MVHWHLWFIRCELLPELLSLQNHKKPVHNNLLKFSIHEKFDPIASVNTPTQFSITII